MPVKKSKMRLITEHIYTSRDDSMSDKVKMRITDDHMHHATAEKKRDSAADYVESGNRKDRRKREAIERRAIKKQKKLISQLRAAHRATWSN